MRPYQPLSELSGITVSDGLSLQVAAGEIGYIFSVRDAIQSVAQYFGSHWSDLRGAADSVRSEAFARWHFRNADNTGPNDGSVNQPQELREFIFSPDVGNGIEYDGSATTVDDVARVRAFGRGWLFIESYVLTPPRAGEFAAFESLKFSACITWPAE